MTLPALQEAARRLIVAALNVPESTARRFVSQLADQAVAFINGAFAGATQTLTAAAAFNYPTVNVGSWLYLYDAGSGTIVPGYYQVAEHTDAGNVVLAADPRTAAAIAAATDPVDVCCILGEVAQFTHLAAADIQDRRERVKQALPALPSPYPDPADVWHTAAPYGANGDIQGTKTASTITNCEPGNIANGVVIDDVTGTLV